MLTDLQEKKLTRYFRVYDIDDDGEIGPRDFARVVENVRILHGLDEGSPAHRAVREGYRRRWDGLRNSADSDADGGVDLGEWLTYWECVVGSDERWEEEVGALVERLFDVFDTDEDGVIGPAEFRDFYGIYGLPASLAERVFQRLDPDGDGVISREELVEIAREFYRGDDPGASANHLYGPVG